MTMSIQSDGVGAVPTRSAVLRETRGNGRERDYSGVRVLYLGQRSADVSAAVSAAVPGAELTFVDAEPLHGLSVDGDAVVVMDGSHDPSDVPALLDAAGRRSVGMVVGSRSVSGGRDGSSLARRVGTRVANLVIRHTVDLPVHDVTSSFRVYSGDAWRSIGGVSVLRDGVLPALIASAHAVHHQRWVIAEVPVSTLPTSTRTLSDLASAAGTVATLARRRRA